MRGAHAPAAGMARASAWVLVKLLVIVMCMTLFLVACLAGVLGGAWLVYQAVTG